MHVELALVVGIAAVIVWGAVLVRFASWYRAGRERRWPSLTMPIVGILAAIGSLCSAIGYGVQLGTLPDVIDTEWLTLGASMGRGALAAGALVILLTVHPPERRP